MCFRIKEMILFILLLILFPFNGGINLTYVVKKDKNKILPSCIAEEFERYEAVDWIYPIPTNEQQIPLITTKFITTIKNNYNCDFSKNNICSKRWMLKDWTIDDSTRTKQFIGDYRWEELPLILISNNTKEFKDRIEIKDEFYSGISVRASGLIELLVCSGWNPYNHPCYHFNINNKEIYLNKYSVLPQKLVNITATFLEHYNTVSVILSHDEWRNFVISFDKNRTLKLFDVNLNRTVIKHVDQDNFKPMYLMMRSSEASLWKVHNDEFLFTNTTQTSRLGPQLQLSSKDLCVSMLVSVCENCEMIFFYQNLTSQSRKILKYVGPSKNLQWMEIKLKEENIQTEKLNIFVETKMKDSQSNESGFWAIDNIRICNENEVKVSYLKLNETEVDDEEEEYISCQLVTKPSWRPKKLVYNKIKDFPDVTVLSNSTSIKLSWTEEDTGGDISYFISYQANDICISEPFNVKRRRSSGFLTTKYNEIILEKLIPFTLYNITVSTVLHEGDKNIYMNTLETVKPTFEELPQKVQIRTSNSAVYVSWLKVPCTSVYGRLIYTLIVRNDALNFTKKISLQTEDSYQIDGLQPYTPYTLTILTARNAANMYQGIHTNKMVFNFTTLPGVAPPVENLELYSIDQTSASLRYNLPNNLNGIPNEIKLVKCGGDYFSKCKPYISRLKQCSLWPHKLCVYVNNLIPTNLYFFKVSLKYRNGNTFGEEVTVSGKAVDRVDYNISTEYCNLNVSWLHPYNENGTITAFNIILNGTHNESEHIHEVLKVENKSYLQQYTYKIKYLPYSTQYKLYLQSANELYRSNFTQLIVNTDHLGDHIDQKPVLLEKTDHSLLFKLPSLDRRLESYEVTVVVQDFDSKKEIDRELLKNKKIANRVCHKFGNTWISQIVKVENNDSTRTIMISTSENGKINPNTKYCISFIISNKYKGAEHIKVIPIKLKTPGISSPPSVDKGSGSNNSHLYVLLLLLLLLPIGFLIYRYLKKRRVRTKSDGNDENVYESLPFEECTNNCVNNDNYDHLLHK